MRIRLPFALGCAALLLVLGSRNVFWGDYFVEAWPAYFGLRTDGFDAFLRLMPAYSGFASLIGAPTALLGAGMDWTFRLNALPGLLALVGLATAAARPRARPRPARDRRSSPARPSPTSRSTRATRRTCSPPPPRPPASSPPCASRPRSPPSC